MNRKYHFSQCEAIIEPPEPKTYTLTVCKNCREEIQRVQAGDDSLRWCEGCQSVEPDTVEIEYDQNDEEVA